MVTGRNLAIVELVRIDIPQEDRCAVFPLQPELLIEIAIVDFASPTHTDGVAAHQPIDRGRIKRADEQLHVFIELVVVPQISGKAPDGEIGNGVKLIEHYAEVREKLALEIGVQLRLRPRQERADRIINKMQRHVTGDAVAELIQQLKRGDARFKNAFPALRIYIFWRVTRHRGDNFNL